VPGPIAIALTGLSTVIALPLLAVASLTGGDPTCPPSAPPPTTPILSPATAGPRALPSAATPATNTRWDGDQLANASTIIAVGQAKHVPPWGWVVAVATAMQESHLRNLPSGSGDSIGLFQQRPSQGWGTRTQLTSPTYQAGTFYDALLSVRDWQDLPLTDAAQAVQKSHTPDAYTKWTDAAVHLVTGGMPADPRASAANSGQGATNPQCLPGDGDGLPSRAEDSLPTGFTLPAQTPAKVATAIGWALQQLGTPYSYGGDCTAPHSGDPTHQCDCSSLAQMAYRAAGRNLPRTTSDQVHTGSPVPDPALIQPGDLVFIPGSHGSRTAPRHVGIYLGQGLIVNAPNTGDHVRITTLTHWSPVAAIRRIVT
jgi:cell wall-associated NlpC family hydrolase